MADSYLSFGTYDHDPASCQFQIEKFPVIGGTGRIEHIRHRWTILFWLQATNVDDLTAEIEYLEAAYLPGGGDLKFMLGPGDESAHTLLTADCLNGTVVHPIQWLGTSPRGSGVEYWRRRSGRIVVEGDVDPADQDSDIVYWSETIERLGDGTPQNVWVESLTGTVEPQQTVTNTRCVTIQRGVALGRTTRPAANTPIWGSPYYQARSAGLGAESARNVFRNASRNYGHRWRYEFHSAAPLVGGPTEF